MFRELLKRDFSFHNQSTTSDLISTTASKVGLGVFNVLLPMMLLITSILSAVAIALGLFLMAPSVTVVVIFFIASIYGVIFFLNKANISRMGRELSDRQSALYRVLQEGFSAIREIILYKKQHIYISRYSSADFRVKRILSDSLVVASAPRYLVETIGISAIAVAAYTVAVGEGGLAASIPIFGLFVFAAQRLLPAVQLMYQNAIAIKVGIPACVEVIQLFEQNRLASSVKWAKDDVSPDAHRFREWRSLELLDVGFSYASRPSPVLVRCNFKLNRGDVVGIVGRSGNGKSTLIDVMMGLQVATSGKVMVDGLMLDAAAVSSWQSQIAHVPQQVFLHEGSVLENVAFELDQSAIDRDAVYAACSAVGLDGLISSFPHGYETRLGERGSSLSGGQRQRIGIARALYRKASVLFLDEATSALDDDSESLVLECLESVKQISTIVMITHKPKTLSICSRIVELSGGRISSEFRSYAEYMSSRSTGVM